MSVTTINNQPIRFQNEEMIDESCDCIGQNFCQLINKNDQTRFQLSSADIVTNGDFESNLDGWDIFESIEVSAAITNESGEGECDGEIEVTATGGTGPYTYSIDGGAFGASNTFTNLCSGTYVITVKDSEGNEGSLSVTIVENIVCGDYSGSTTDDLLPLLSSQILNCNTDDFI
jgi:hypothetical protein